MPDSCCLSDVVGCGKNVLTENDENVSYRYDVDFSQGLVKQYAVMFHELPCLALTPPTHSMD